MDRDHKRAARAHFVERVKERHGIKLKNNQVQQILNQVRSGKLQLCFTKGNRKVYYYKIQNNDCRIVYDVDLDELVTILRPGTDYLSRKYEKKRKSIAII